ncbi:FAD-dependent monooxygenase [Streptomyces sp. NPDC127068]|uniref:FAD-dependent monooxygenase n=1 Tax=Streptomyces sp. NPDC127068 TaxID=3347127 RepID=UPI0036543728
MTRVPSAPPVPRRARHSALPVNVVGTRRDIDPVVHGCPTERSGNAWTRAARGGPIAPVDPAGHRLHRVAGPTRRQGRTPRVSVLAGSDAPGRAARGLASLASTRRDTGGCRMIRTGGRVRVRAAVVGGRPAGSALAGALPRAATEVRLFERHPREVVERWTWAGLPEHQAVAHPREQGLAANLLAEGRTHEWCDLPCQGRQIRLDHAARTHGAHHRVRPRRRLVRDRLAAPHQTSGPPHFERPVLGPCSSVDDRPRLWCAGLDIDRAFIVGCDGARGVIGQVVPPTDCGASTRRCSDDRLTRLVETDRSAPGALYAAYKDGPAGPLPRTRHLARLYLQIPASDALVRGHPRLVGERLRTRQAGTSQYARVFAHRYVRTGPAPSVHGSRAPRVLP